MFGLHIGGVQVRRACRSARVIGCPFVPDVASRVCLLLAGKFVVPKRIDRDHAANLIEPLAETFAA